MYNNKTLKKYEARIHEIKEEICRIRDMRPGSLTQQIFKKGEYTRPYWQISYTQNKKSKTEYVREDSINTLKQEVAEYQKFKTLTAKWVELAIKISKEKIKEKNKLNSL